MSPTSSPANSATSLPAAVQQSLDDLLKAARESFADNLRSVVLFGSAAEGQLRATSDVNLIFVLTRFDPAQAASFQGALQMATAAIRASVMFLLEQEIDAAMDAFAVKFADIGHRRRVLLGEDPFAGRTPSRDAIKRRIRQTLLNLELRLRERLAMAGHQESRLTLVVADAAGPLRSIAAAVLDLEGRPAASPKAALAALMAEWPEATWHAVLQNMSSARQTGTLPAGVGRETLVGVLALADRLRQRIGGLD
jgi:predicted nucleotidyltransferase